MARRQKQSSAGYYAGQQRLAGLLTEVADRPLLSSLIHLLLWGVNQWLRVERFLRRKFKHTKPGVLPLTPPAPLVIPGKPRVLLIVEDRLPQCYRYRVAQKLEQLSTQDIAVKAIPWTDAVYQPDELNFHHIVIFYRVPGYENVLDLIATAKALGKIVIYETDDIIFDADIQRETIESSYRQISPKLQRQLLRGTHYYREAMAACDWGLASTPALAEQMERVLGGGKVLVHPNGIDQVIEQAAHSVDAEIANDSLTIFYGSGTRTHDADLELIAEPLGAVLENYPEARLVLVGTISLPKHLEAYASQVVQLPLVETSVYLQLLKQADIAIAPLVPGVFADCKSEIKWLEAAMLRVPAVVSATRSFADAIDDGIDGMLAGSSEDWQNKLSELIDDSALRQSIANSAHQKALDRYSPDRLGRQLANQLQELAGNAGVRILAKDSQPRVCIVGDPAEIEGITTAFDKEVTFSVLCEGDSQAGAISTQAGVEGYEQTLLSGSLEDHDLGELVVRYLEYVNPALILISAPGRLTDAVTKGAKTLDFPFVVMARHCNWLSASSAECDDMVVDIDPVAEAAKSGNTEQWLGMWQSNRRILEEAKRVVTINPSVQNAFEKAGFQCELVDLAGLQGTVLAVINPPSLNG